MPGILPGLGAQLMSPASFNPMELFNKPMDPRQLQMLAQMRVLLGGLGSQVLSPSLARPPVQPEVNKMRPILGGTISG